MADKGATRYDDEVASVEIWQAYLQLKLEEGSNVLVTHEGHFVEYQAKCVLEKAN